jgi:hypothetical protein
MKTVYRVMNCVEAFPGYEGLAEDQKSSKSLNRVPSFSPNKKKKLILESSKSVKGRCKIETKKV